jgi:hypothetical protein
MTPSGSVQAGAEMLKLVDQVREDATSRGALAASQTFRTADGEVTVDYRAGDWLRITFTGDRPERTHVLPPDWGSA